MDAYFNRAELYKELEEYNKSIEDYNKILELNPKDKDCYNNRAIVYYLIKIMINHCRT
ncbi:tetratricopeptide repeat protein [Clostridium botulinum]|nr:tetratricopeptide repeat protein [Clostridium botulinum]MCS4517337.1 tetratricopeptide repeat protein [Clostridium botulinum]MCS4525342.1 tetratricopeptide repeat protein [Clostridium botulinum]MCS4525942.1 tetratricopeptide repeat protein [Clostridium botulinum]